MTTTMSPIEAGALRLLAQEIMEREGIPGSAPPWSSLARVAQLPPDGDWATWLYLGGRGAGKTRSGAEWVKAMVENGVYRRWALAGPTAADVRDVMVEGESGLLSVYPLNRRPDYEPSKRRITWANGAVATLFSADEPARMRGPQHEAAWCDEVGVWRRPEAFDMLMLGLRLGPKPRVAVTTTPRPTKLIRALLADPHTAVTRSTTFENLANLAPQFREYILARYEGTRLGLQELYAEILEAVEGALWTLSLIDSARVQAGFELKMTRVVVGVDPPGGAVECGIVVAGRGEDGHYYVLEDASILASPDRWAGQVIDAYQTFRADRVVGESNYGGDMVENTIRQAARARGVGVSYKAVHATRGKAIRAEPIAALYEQGRVHHVGIFPTLESEQCGWVPGEAATSPNRMDALVWALTELSQRGEPTVRFM